MKYKKFIVFMYVGSQATGGLGSIKGSFDVQADAESFIDQCVIGGEYKIVESYKDVNNIDKWKSVYETVI